MASRGRVFNRMFKDFANIRKGGLQTSSNKWRKSIQQVLTKPSSRYLTSSSKIMKALSQERTCMTLAMRTFPASVAVGQSLHLPPLLIAAGGTEIDCIDALANADDDETFSSEDEALSGTIMALLTTNLGRTLRP